MGANGSIQMYESFRLPPAERPAPVENASLVAAQRRFGFLSGAFNAVLAVWAIILVLTASLEMSPIERYPIENTLRSASKRPLVLIDAKGQTFARRGECVAAPVTVAEFRRSSIATTAWTHAAFCARRGATTRPAAPARAAAPSLSSL